MILLPKPPGLLSFSQFKGLSWKNDIWLYKNLPSFTRVQALISTNFLIITKFYPASSSLVWRIMALNWSHKSVPSFTEFDYWYLSVFLPLSSFFYLVVTNWTRWCRELNSNVPSLTGFCYWVSISELNGVVDFPCVDRVWWSSDVFRWFIVAVTASMGSFIGVRVPRLIFFFSLLFFLLCGSFSLVFFFGGA